MSSFNDPFMLELFHTELETHARVLETGLVKAEGETAAAIEPLMRAAHSLKGAARMVGIDPVVTLAHAMEDVLSAAQHGRIQLASHHVDALLRANDVFLTLAKLPPAQVPETATTRAAEMAALAEAVKQTESAAPPAATPAAPPAATPAAPPAATPAPAPVVAPAAPPQEPAPAAPPAAETRPAPADDGYVRVRSDNLDRLIGLAGESLVQAKTLKSLRSALRRIQQGQAELGSVLAEASTGDGTAPHLIERLQELLLKHADSFTAFSQRMERVSNRLYLEAVATRMRPFSDALHGFPRMVRDLAKSLGKSARLEIEGANVQVDRDILEKLEAALTHLLRNAVDHGLESPEGRAAAGKTPEGRILLAARHASGLLNITVSDDGRGIGVGKLRTEVVARGLAPEAMAEGFSDAELFEFLFLPGFSTRTEVSQVSGRGVGLDVVQSMVRQVGGAVRVESSPGAGTTFHLRLPLTLSVVRTLLFDIGGEAYALPLSRIDRCLRVPPSEVRTVEDRQYCTVDGVHIGIVEATQALQLPPKPRGEGDWNTIVVSDGQSRYGVVVDAIAGERELVVSPLARRLGKTLNLSAGAILEDGSPVLILDAEDLVHSIDKLLTQGSLQKLRSGTEQARVSRKRVLVVDDSLTVREVERRLLENRGYDVTIAVDGMDGWSALQGGRFDLLVTDVDMPRMDGFELVRRLRASAQLSALPVVIVSYKDQEEYRMQGLEAGANAYLTKSSFHDEGLLKTVSDLIGEA